MHGNSSKKYLYFFPQHHCFNFSCLRERGTGVFIHPSFFQSKQKRRRQKSNHHAAATTTEPQRRTTPCLCAAVAETTGGYRRKNLTRPCGYRSAGGEPLFLRSNHQYSTEKGGDAVDSERSSWYLTRCKETGVLPSSSCYQMGAYDDG